MQSGLVERTPDRVLTLAESMSNTKINEAAGGALRIAEGAVTEREMGFGAVHRYATTDEVVGLSSTAVSKIPTGALVQTAGKAATGDGGGGTFVIEATGTANGGTVIALADGRYARMVNWNGDVRVFGAKGDGIADDTAAIQAAIDAEDYVYIPAGTYNISNTIELKTFSHVEGDGFENTVLLWTGEAGGTMMSGPGERIHGVRLSNFALNCDKIADVGLDENGMTYCDFNNVYAKHPTYAGFWLHSGGKDSEGKYTYVGLPCYYNRHTQCRVYAKKGFPAAPPGSKLATFGVTLSGGSVDSISVENGRSGFDLNDPMPIMIFGDGEGATAEIGSVDGTGKITSVTVTAGGSGYTWAVAVPVPERLETAFCDYGFLLDESANGHYFDRCNVSYARIGFAITHGPGTDSVDPESDNSTQNTLISCSSEPCLIGMLINGEFGNVIGHRMETTPISYLWGPSTRNRFNTVIGTTFYSATAPGRHAGFGALSSNYGNQVFDYTAGATDTSMGDVTVDTLTIKNTAKTNNIDLYKGTYPAAVRFGLNNNLRMLLVDEATGAKFQAYDGSTFEDVVRLVAHTATTPARAAFDSDTLIQLPRASTANRPDVSAMGGPDRIASILYESTLRKLILHDGTSWIDVNGSRAFDSQTVETDWAGETTSLVLVHRNAAKRQVVNITSTETATGTIILHDNTNNFMPGEPITLYVNFAAGTGGFTAEVRIANTSGELLWSATGGDYAKSYRIEVYPDSSTWHLLSVEDATEGAPVTSVDWSGSSTSVTVKQASRTKRQVVNVTSASTATGKVVLSNTPTPSEFADPIELYINFDDTTTGFTVEIREGSDSGSILWSKTGGASAKSYRVLAYWDGGNWQLLSSEEVEARL